MNKLKYTSQKGQDKWVVEEIFNFKKRGYFVDLAATNGIKINNTLVLETELQWSGICIEPNPAYFKKLQKNRNCITDNSCIDVRDNKIVSFRVDNKGLGGIVAPDTDNNYAARGRAIKRGRVLRLKTATLQSVLDKYKAPKIIDFLSLDVEGAETRVLKKFPFNKYTFLSLCIEGPRVNLEKILFSNGYKFITKDYCCGSDSFYVHESIPNYNEIKKTPYSPSTRKPL